MPPSCFAKPLLVISLTQLYTERELKRKIHVALPERTPEGIAHFQTIRIEPDASLQFLITETWHKPPQTWEDFFHLEIYRTLPPAEWRFTQKIKGYVASVDTGWHEALFQTPALSIAVIAHTPQMATTLKRWTEEVLTELDRPEEGDWFFFSSLDTATASPEELFLSPCWEPPFRTAKTPLLVLAEHE